jgi:3-oxoacyl-[acyl-carrier protein] reductase
MITLGTAKAALDQFVRYVALELAPHGITANLVAPSTVEGPKATELVTAKRMHELAAAIPMGRLVRPDEVAETVAFLASEESGFTTGHYLPVNGGLVME